jgi:hypothetical protein
VKPTRGGIKKIDGIVSAVMSLAGAMAAPGEVAGKYYESNMLEVG